MDWLEIKWSESDQEYFEFQSTLINYYRDTLYYIAFTLPILYSQFSKQKFSQKVRDLEDQLEYYYEKNKNKSSGTLYYLLLKKLRELKFKVLLKNKIS